ncbi:MAG: Maf family protein [bacterium]
MKFILASASPDRKRLLELALPFPITTIPSSFNESSIKITDPQLLALTLAKQKNQTVNQQLTDKTDTILLGSDTLVAFQNTIIGKAENKEHAREILSMLSGSTHQLITAFYLLKTSPTEDEFSETVVTNVTMKPISDEEMDHYLAGTSWKNKAGAYGIQEDAGKFIPKIDGCFLNVVGLPLCRIATKLASWGITLNTSAIKTECQRTGKMICQIK